LTISLSTPPITGSTSSPAAEKVRLASLTSKTPIIIRSLLPSLPSLVPKPADLFPSCIASMLAFRARKNRKQKSWYLSCRTTEKLWCPNPSVPSHPRLGALARGQGEGRSLALPARSRIRTGQNEYFKE